MGRISIAAAIDRQMIAIEECRLLGPSLSLLLHMSRTRSRAGVARLDDASLESHGHLQVIKMMVARERERERECVAYVIQLQLSSPSPLLLAICPVVVCWLSSSSLSFLQEKVVLMCHPPTTTHHHHPHIVDNHHPHTHK